MARINNQAVMQKLIDDLNLYPGADVIPTELAEKILPVFNVNEQDVKVTVSDNLKMQSCEIVRTAQGDSPTGVTVYTTPATGVFYLTSVFINATHSGNATASRSYSLSGYVGGTIRKFVDGIVENATPATAPAQQTALTFSYPIKMSPNTIIAVFGYTGEVRVCGGITGFYVAP